PPADHHGRVPPRWQAARPQGEGRYRGAGSRQRRPCGREGADLATLPGQALEPDAARARARPRRQRAAADVPPPAPRPGSDAGRPWRIAEALDAHLCHTSATAIRARRRDGPDEPAKYHYRFKHMTTVGEPIEPAVWKWYHNMVGKGQAVIVDTWWQTENGG